MQREKRESFVRVNKLKSDKDDL